jgi:DNA end-binding protein Ku
MVNPGTGKEVRNDEIRKGYEVAPDTFVIVEDKDLEKLEPEASTTIELASFLPQGKIGHQYYNRRTTLAPMGTPRHTLRWQTCLREKNERASHAG